jgi:hypothetical protein
MCESSQWLIFNVLCPDLIFILLDRPDEAHDRMISEHVMRGSGVGASADAGGDAQSHGPASKRARTQGPGSGAGAGASFSAGGGRGGGGSRITGDWAGTGGEGGSGGGGGGSVWDICATGRSTQGAGMDSSFGDDAENDALCTLSQRLRRQIQRLPYAPASLFLLLNQGRASSTSTSTSSCTVPVELMRRYIEYAKKYVHPTLSPAAAKVLQRLYLTMRAEASERQSIPVTTRHLESLIRLAQARARVDLREEVGWSVLPGSFVFCFLWFCWFVALVFCCCCSCSC